MTYVLLNAEPVRIALLHGNAGDDAALAICVANPAEIALTDGPSEEVKWIHLASEGEYRGHNRGAFRFDRGVFEAFIRNLHAHPHYDAGKTDVIAYDFNHASEMAPYAGNIPVDGTPARSWLRELEVRDGPDGRAQLWGLTNLLEPARTYLKQKAYKWVSLAVNFKGKHFQTGADIGPVITSVAFTNQPFLRDLQPIAASAQQAATIGDTNMQIDLAKVAVKLGLRPDSSEDAVFAHIKTLKLAALTFDFDTEDDVSKFSEQYEKDQRELKELRAFKLSSTTEAAEKDVTRVIKQSGVKDTPAQRKALLALRLSDPKQFAEDYPEDAVEKPNQQLLGQRMTDRQHGVTAAPRRQQSKLDGVQVGRTGLMLGAQSAPAGPPDTYGHGNDDSQGEAPWANCMGANDVDKAMTFLAAQPGGKDAPVELLWGKACDMVRKHKATVAA